MITTSRRKQTKPIRVYEDYGSTQPPAMPPGEQYPYSNGSSASHDDSGVQDDDMPMDLHVSIISCSKCPETFPTQDDLARHTASVHTKPQTVEKPKDEDRGYPTAYHRLGREFQQENKFLNGHEDQTVPVSDMMSDSNQAESRDMLGVPVNKGDTNRIFHQDAFCELCEREFCNKYFLKTHKANKHGIYENSTSPFSMNSTSGSSPVSMVMPPEPSMQLPISLKVEQPSSKPILAFPKSEPKLSTTVKLEATKPEVPIQKPAPEIKREPLHVSKPPSTSVITTAIVTSSMSSMSSNNNSGSSSSSTSVPRLDMEDYCEICQKHFCNKYYLKKHKQDVHGIVPETPTTPQSGKRRHIPSSIGALDSQSPMVSVSTSSQMILPPPVVNMGLPNMPLNMPGVMVLNPFMPPVAIIPAQSLLPQQPSHSQPSAIISQPLSVCSVSEIPSSTAAAIITTSTTTSSHDSSGNLDPQSKMLPSVSNDALRGIGVLNAEAYCELCRKEFCNKYFLKVHRANKHGIFSDDLCSLPFGMSCEALDASMLAGMKMPLDMKMEPGSQSSPNAGSSSESPVTFCNLCNTEFSSKYSYKIHRMNVHGMLNEGFFDGSDLSMMPTDLSSSEGLLKVAAEAQMAGMKTPTSSSTGDGSATTIFGNMIAAKLADRVICDICNKELTNKYFLKAHKLRVHGIDLSPQEKAAEAAAAAAFSSGKQTPISSTGMKTPVSNAKDQRDLSIITAEMITQDILQRSQTLNLSKKQHDLSHLTPESSTEKPSSDELVKLGIDPEAYCEICKKEFCSKYFLRTHKLNIHGIRSDKLEGESATKVSTPYSSAPKNILPKSSPMGMSSVANSVNNITSNFHNTFLNSSLFSMAGFNPFGPQGGMPGFPGLPGFPGMPSLPGLNLTSSLFGPASSISSINSSSSNAKLKDHLRESRGSKEQSGKVSSKEGPTMSPVTTTSASSPVTSAPTGSSVNGNSGSKSKEGFERHTWRWKEPANSSRVSCEICNKELCNKYFLRTHKLNKHGIVPSVGSNSPAPSDTETASNASSSEKPDLGVSDKNGQTPSHTPKQDHSPLPSPGGDKSEKPSSLFKPTQLFKFKTEDDILNNRSYNSFAEICNICDRRFKNDHWLKAHIMKDHGGWPMMDMYKFGGSTPPVEGPVLGVPDPKTCQVCGLQFPSELSMQLHLIQEHNAQVTLKEDGDTSASGDEGLVTNFSYGLGFRKRVSRTDKLKMYVCLFCHFKTRWISNLYEHEEMVHNIYKNRKLYPKSFPSKLLVDRHAENVHGDKPLDISSSGSKKTVRPKRRFRCVLCGERFLSRAVCSKHLRQVHIRSLKDFSPTGKSKHSCSMCKFSTFYPRLLQLHMSRSHDDLDSQSETVNHNQDDDVDANENEKSVARKEVIINNVFDAPVIQSFNLDVKKPDSIFLPAVAQMPVREKVDKVMAVTFVLTPVNP